MRYQFLLAKAIALTFATFTFIAQESIAQDDFAMGFFITSSGPGNGADLGGLAGADAHCQALAAAVGSGDRIWRAYLSAQAQDDQLAVNARDRIGSGPWYNAAGVIVANNVEELHGQNNVSKETALNERGEIVNGRGDSPNRHDILTGSQLDGTVAPGDGDSTCDNWTSSGAGSASVGHHDRQGGGNNPTSWNSAHASRGCSQADLQSTGGDGLFYCFALMLVGDFNGDGLLDIVDLERLTSEIQAGATETFFDLDQSGTVDLADRQFWVTDVKLTWIGDANLDGAVTFDDFLALSSSFAQAGSWELGDFDGNGQIEFPDFLALSANFGQVANAAGAAVPEPAGAGLALFGILGLIGFRRPR